MTLAHALDRDDTSDPKTIQRKASNPSASAWVSASAGTGKTTVLTSRVIRLLLEGVRPEKILCLTYTRAAAAEMANRIMDVLGKWAVCDEPELREAIQDLQNAPAKDSQLKAGPRLFAQALACPGGLRIRTIHSFCQEILSRFPIEAGLPPQFSVIEPQDLKILSGNVLDDLLRRAAAEPDGEIGKALAAFVAAQGEKRIADILKEVLKDRHKIEKAVRQAGGRTRLKAEIRQVLGVRSHDTPHSIRAEAMRDMPEADIRKMVAWLSEGSDRYSRRSEVLFEILSLTKSKRADKFDAYARCFLKEDNNLFSPSFVASKPIRSAHPEIDDLAFCEGTRLKEVLGRIEAAENAEATEHMLAFGLAFADDLARRKAARGVLDYDDLIFLTERLLRGAGACRWVLYKLDTGIDHILIDEAQDTSDPQWAIVQALTDEFFAGQSAKDGVDRTLFVVGDEKQSIFSFQGANMEAFLTQRAAYARRLGDAERRLDAVSMHTSFRSAPAVLNAVDSVFERLEARQGVSADIVRHFPFDKNEKKYGRVELWPLAAPSQRRSEEAQVFARSYGEESDPEIDLARRIADTIAKWRAQKTVLPGCKKPIAPGDIMILLRRRRSFAPLMVRLLKERDIPVTGVDRMRLVRQLPVMDLLALMRFALLPEDDLNLAALLRSPLIGLSENDLMALALEREDTLWRQLRLSGKHKAVEEYLSSKLKIADYVSPFDFLTQALTSPCPANPRGGRAALWARLGLEAMDPIDELLNAAQEHGHNSAPSFQKFLQWLTEADAEIKRELDKGNPQDGGQVRIMTVHASKGLEAPIVFLPDGASLPQSNHLSPLQWSDDGLPFFLVSHAFGAAKALWDKARDKQLEEYRRLLYVAMTRAINRLYICGWTMESKKIPDECWYRLAEQGLKQSACRIEAEESPDVALVAADPCLPAKPSPGLEDKKPPPPSLPPWALKNAPAETEEAVSAAVYDEATPDSAFARGRLIHRLLQSLPDVEPSERPEAVGRFLAQARHGLDEAKRREIAEEVGRLLKDERFAALFGGESRAEVPLVGPLNGANAFRQVDRLCLRGDEVWIVDYKTNRPPPALPEDIPPAYRKQLEEYRVLLSAVYPDRNVRCFLLWTYAPTLMEVA